MTAADGPDRRPGGATQASLVKTMRDTARWRRAKGYEFAEEDHVSKIRGHRAMVRIQAAAKFVEQL